MKKPVLYVQRLPDKHKLAFDFCYSAKLGAEQLGIKTKTFINSDDVPGDPTNILVGSVEACSNWLFTNGYPVPEPVNLLNYVPKLGRNIGISHINDIGHPDSPFKYPLFIKPHTQIKAFTGFVATDDLTKKVFSENYDGWVLFQDVIEIVSEYRLYVSNNRPIGMKHYRGDCLTQPSEAFVRNCFNSVKSTIDHHSYTLDFGVLDNGYTVLIEINDGWAIGNYGLEPQTYYLFVRNRWLQMTGIRKRMDGV